MWLHVLLVYCQFALLFVNNKACLGFYMVGLHDLTVHVQPVYDLNKLCISNSIWMNGVYKSGIIQSEFSCKMLLRNIKYCQIRPYHSDITNFHRIFPVWSKWNLLHMLHIYMKCRCAYPLRLPIWMLQRLAPYYILQYFLSLFHCLSQGLHEKLSKMPSYFIYSFHANIIMSYECYICT